MALEKWRKWRKSGIDPFGRYGQPELGVSKSKKIQPTVCKVCNCGGVEAAWLAMETQIMPNIGFSLAYEVQRICSASSFAVAV
jgi:hypothetical protein